MKRQTHIAAAPPVRRSYAAYRSSRRQQRGSLSEKLRGKNARNIIALLYIGGMTVVFPLWDIGYYYENLARGRLAWFYTATATALAAWAVIATVQWLGEHMGRASSARAVRAAGRTLMSFARRLTFTDAALLLFIISVLLSTLLSDDRKVSFFGNPDRCNGFLVQAGYAAVFFLLSRCLRPDRRCLALFSMGGTVTAVVLLLHFFGVDVMDIGFRANKMFVGPMGNVDFTSYYLTVATVLTAALYVTEELPHFDRKGYGGLGCFALLLWAQLVIKVDTGAVATGTAFLASLPLLLTSMRRVERMMALLSVGFATAAVKLLTVDVWKRGGDFGGKGMLLTAAALTMAGLTVWIRSGRIRRKPSAAILRRAALGIDAAVPAAGLAASAYASGHASSGTLWECGQMLFYGNWDGSFGNLRLVNWQCCLRVARMYPWFGVGPDRFADAMRTYCGDALAPYFSGYMLSEAHNEYLHILVTSGIFALLAFLAFVGSLTVLCCRRAARDSMAACCALAVIAYAVHAFFMPALPIHTPLMWVMLGMAGAVLRRPVRA